MQNSLDYSRPIAAAARLGENALDRHRFTDKRVLLTGEPSILLSPNGRSCLLDSLRLLIRICKNLTVSIPKSCSSLLADCRSIAEQIVFDSTGIVLTIDQSNFDQYDAILSVGTTMRPKLPWTVINSDGWLARVSSVMTSLPPSCGRENPIASFGAACLGVGDVFKRLIGLKEVRGRLLDGYSFSLFSYHSSEEDDGPELPQDVPLQLLVIGIGAIGNGIVHLIETLPTSGTVWLVDPQEFQPENLGTCLLIGSTDIYTKKAQFAEKRLIGKLIAKGYCEDISSFRNRLGTEIPYPKVIVNGLDNIPARHAVQNLWTDIVIDGAISDFGCQVSRHPWGEDVACLLCLFKEPAESAEHFAHLATGLSLQRIQKPFEPISQEDVERAPSEKKDWLRARLGKQTCAVVQEGVAQQISKHKHTRGFEPSVPFVAGFSACMVTSELVKHILGWTSPLETRFQFDFLRGPALGQAFPQERKRDCLCVTRVHNIEKFRAQIF